MLEFLKNIFKGFAVKAPEKLPEDFTGALLTKDPVGTREDDIKFDEIVASANTPIWTEKPESKWRVFPELNQFGSFMCGAFSMKKLVGVYYWLRHGVWIEFSEEDIYQRRFNKPGAGMSVDDLYKIIGDGVTLKLLTGVFISEDADADNAKISIPAQEVGKAFKMGKKIVLPADIDVIASVIQTTGKAVHYMTFFTSSEWGQLQPQIYNRSLNGYAPSTLRHFVTFTDSFLYNGRKVLLVEDSAHFGGISRRLVDQEWLSKRSLAITYPMNFKYEGGGDRPVFDGSVISTQRILRYEGFFPSNVSFTENIGPVTKEALKKFQAKYGIDPVGTLGPITKAKLAELYS